VSHRKDYRPLTNERLDRLKADTLPLLGTIGSMVLPAETIYWMVMEIIDSREEIFRLQLCETVDSIIANELDDGEEDLLSFPWPDNPYLVSDMLTPVLKPAFPCKDTAKLVRPTEPSSPSPEQDGRRMPRAD
jgi:hypothetical protein